MTSLEALDLITRELDDNREHDDYCLDDSRRCTCRLKDLDEAVAVMKEMVRLADLLERVEKHNMAHTDAIRLPDFVELYVSLHSGDPGFDGSQNEIAGIVRERLPFDDFAFTRFRFFYPINLQTITYFAMWAKRLHGDFFCGAGALPELPDSLFGKGDTINLHIPMVQPTTKG
jgi:hypothetical protein